MKSFLTVLKFELMHYFKNKAFVISTIVLLVIIAGGLSIPTVIEAIDNDDTSVDESDTIQYGLIDKLDIIKDDEAFATAFYLGDLVIFDDLEALKSGVISGDLTGGFVIYSDTTYDYIILNNELSDAGVSAFEQPFKRLFQKQAFEEQDINFESIENLLEPEITHNIEVLGKDSKANYLYTYILVFALYMIIIMYGQLIATAVASEKSNRTMELLVTSTKSSNLIFGKVIGGSIASVLQVLLLLGVAKTAYQFNSVAWSGRLDFVFDIPTEVLLNFAAFGFLGFLFYAFIYGALGALASKTEDINSSSMPITLLFVGVFMISMLGMQNTESVILKVASFVPFSSFMAMFIRISMGEVAWYEVVISLSLLIATTGFIGWFASKIYRMGTLMYGNPVKMKDIPKILKSQ